MKQIKIILFVLYFIVTQFGTNAQNSVGNTTKKKQFLKEWEMQSSTQITTADEIVSTSGFNCKNWVKAEVPTTVLSALVKAGIYPDPHFDLNNLRIPDASDDLSKRLDLNKYTHLEDVPNPFKDPYWFRTTFQIPPEKKGKKVWLNFDGINYRADVWLNGKQIANAQEMAGMFLRFKYNVTDFINQEGENILAVKVHQVDHIGTPNPGFQFEPFGPSRGSSEDIWKDVTLKFSGGWDCAPVVRDRNMGIYQDVYLIYSDDVLIINPYIVTDLPLPDTTRVNISVSTELKNVGESSVKGVLKGAIDLIKEIDFYTYKKKMPGHFKTVMFEKEVDIPAGKTITVSFSPEEFSQLIIKNPYLWWPNGYGKQYLHNLNLSFEIDGKVSDVQNTAFGIREITNTFKEIDGEFGRIFWINGKRIFCRGGFLQPDMMLDMNEKRIYDEIRFLAEANINMIASEDMPSPPDYVMDICDKYGMLVWEVFYQCWTSYPGTRSMAYPLDTELSLKNDYDIIKRYRNHPSLVMWVGQIETMFREELYVPLRQYIKELDPTRPFLPTSSCSWDVDKLTPYIKPDLPLGMTDEGEPDYTWYPHPFYYNKVLEIKKQMFRNEMGVPAISTLSSMQKYIFDLGQGKKDSIYPLDKKWAYHDAWDGDGYAYRAYDKAIREGFGQPSTVEEYIRHAQYVNAGSYRAMFEAANHRMWDITSGVMIWKLNATWPQVLWQIYDWFLNPNAAYFYTKKALEPVHIQLNENNFTVSVINTNHRAHNNLTANVRVLNSDMKMKWEKEVRFDIEENRYKELFKLPELKGLTPVYFIKLVLKDVKGNVVSDNFYWFSSLEDEADLSEITKLTRVKLKISHNLHWEDNEGVMNVKVKNPSDKLAFFNRFMITKGDKGDEVLPSFWSDNFFSLLPGEEKIITVRFSKQDLDGEKPVLALDKEI